MGRETLPEVAFRSIAREAKAAGSATHRGEQRHREGKGLHELVDPKGFGLIRRSLSWLEPKGGKFILLRGTAMLEETRLDTTGSMGDNVEIAMEVLPKTYDLLAKGKCPVLRRYDTQMITSIFGDVGDNYVLCRSQAEMDERIAEQMTLMVPEGAGGDEDEDPQYGLFAGAYLTQTTIGQLGLKTYDFTVTDACGRHRLNAETLVRIFGNEVFDKVRENGYQLNRGQLPTTKEVVHDLLNRAHAFVLLVGDKRSTYQFWADIFGRDRVVTLPRTRLLPEVKAAIIGLTEGTLDLQNVEEYLRAHAQTSKEDARNIQRAVAGIPIGAQAKLPNFSKIPLKGAVFAKKGDLWPTGFDPDGSDEPTKPGKKVPPKEGKKPDMWL
jgi:hypothetical protein